MLIVGFVLNLSDRIESDVMFLKLLNSIERSLHETHSHQSGILSVGAVDVLGWVTLCQGAVLCIVGG